MECINSISRPILNQRLLEALPSGIKIRFQTKVSRIDFKTRKAWAKSAVKKAVVPGQEHDDAQIGSSSGQDKNRNKGKGEGGEEDKEGTGFDLCIGCDGSWSKVRSEMMRIER